MESMTTSKNNDYDNIFLRIIYLIFKLIPKNIVSWMVGVLFRIKFPPTIQKFVNFGFVKILNINMAEAEHGINSYESLGTLFARKIQSNTRPITGPLCSPCDGKLTISDQGDLNSALQIKGMPYSLSSLVAESKESFPDLYWYTTIYLAPHNYHRVHTPISGKLVSVKYIPGDLWPVSPLFFKIVPNLYTINERLVFKIDLLGDKKGSVFVVMVGALNVGRISTPWVKDFFTNSQNQQFNNQSQIVEFKQDQLVNIGDELGTFNLGSTTIVVFDRMAYDELKPQQQMNHVVVKMGQKL